MHSSVLGASPCALRALVSAGKSRWELDVTWVSQTRTGRGGKAPCAVGSQPEQFHTHKTHDPIPADDLDGLLGELPEDFFSAPAQAEPSSCC